MNSDRYVLTLSHAIFRNVRTVKVVDGKHVTTVTAGGMSSVKLVTVLAGLRPLMQKAMNVK